MNDLYMYALRRGGISGTYDSEPIIAAVTKTAEPGELTPDEVQTCAVRKVSTGLYAACKARVRLTREEERIALTAPTLTADMLRATKALRLAMEVDAIARSLAREPRVSR